METGTMNGTVTDMNGNFEITLPAGSKIEVSCIGYATQVVEAGTKANIVITLHEDTETLDETVVVGYATQKKANLTGAVATVDVAKDINNRTMNSISNLLAGAAPGLSSIASNEGSRPGSNGSTLKIRGTGTLNDSNPLVVVDGIISDLDQVNPADVENISVLKDAASSAIYGSRAANGVILVTTKKGSSGKATISYTGMYSLEKVAKKYDIVSNYADYMELMNESFINTGYPQQFHQRYIDEWRANENTKDPDLKLKYPNTDWTDVLFRTAQVQNHTVSVSGGNQSVRYFVSGNFYKNPGIIKWTDYQKASFRANLKADINKFISMGMNISGYKSKTDPNSIAAGTGGDAITWGGAMGSPGVVLVTSDGRYGEYNCPDDNVGQRNANAFRRLNFYAHDHPDIGQGIIPKFSLTIKPVEGLEIEGSYTYNYSEKKVEQFLQDFPALWNFYPDPEPGQKRGVPTYKNVNIYLRNWWYDYDYQTVDAVARYNKDFGKLRFGALAGASQERYVYKWNAARIFFPATPAGEEDDHRLDVWNAGTLFGSILPTGNIEEWVMHSAFGRINLNWDDKYLFEANIRTDGSSRFSPENRWGVFPSFSAGWIVSEEGFFPKGDVISFLKLRASWGSLGNNAVGNYAWQSLYSSRNYVLNNGTTASGMSQNVLSNMNITWEKTYVTNIGVDFTMFNQRLTGSLEAYDKTTDGILISLPAALANGTVSIPKQNAAKVSNKGIEANLRWNQTIGDFSYNIAGNVSYNANKVVEFGERSISNIYVIEKGQPMNYLYVMDVDRMVRNESDLAYVQSLVDKNPTYFSTFRRPQLGDYLYKDSNGDGVLNYDDRIKIGHGNQPVLNYGISLSAAWKGFDFSAIFNGVAGWKDLLHDVIWKSNTIFGGTLCKTITSDHYSPENTDAKYPRLLRNTDNRNDIASTAWVYKRDYLRVKNVQLGYTLPASLSRKFFVDKLRFFVSVDNLYTFTEWPGWDPEIGQGQAAQNYPTTRITTFGINITL